MSTALAVPIDEVHPQPNDAPKYQKRLNKITYEKYEAIRRAEKAEHRAEAAEGEVEFLRGENQELEHMLATYQDQIERLIQQLRRTRGR